MKRSLPGINIQYPWSQLLISGQKTIETRFYPLPQKYLSTPLAIIETPGKNGKFKARVVGTITFSDCFAYKTESHFRKDLSKHMVQAESPLYWKIGKTKWAWVVSEITRLAEPIEAPKKRGIVWATKVTF